MKVANKPKYRDCMNPPKTMLYIDFSCRTPFFAVVFDIIMLASKKWEEHFEEIHVATIQEALGGSQIFK